MSFAIGPAEDNVEVLHARVPMATASEDDALGPALEALVAATRSLSEVIAALDERPTAFRVTFETPTGPVSEREFFARAAGLVVLRERTIAYVENVNPKHWREDPFRGSGFWTNFSTPAGALAIVPRALNDVTVLPALAEHLRGSDLDHETFHRALITELVARHGLGEAVLDLLSVRAVDAAGQHGPDDLRWLSTTTELGALVCREPEAFAARVDRQSKRESYRALYVANAGKGLFADQAPLFERWVTFFRGRGLDFGAIDLELDAARKPYAPGDFAEQWEEAASADDSD